MVWKYQEDFSLSDRDADLILHWPDGGRDDFEYNVVRISDGKWVFSFEFKVLSEEEASDEIRIANPGHDYVTYYAVVKSNLTEDQIKIIQNILYAKVNKKNGFAFKVDGVWVKSAVEIIYTDRIEGL